jgi:hypothetical protein
MRPYTTSLEAKSICSGAPYCENSKCERKVSSPSDMSGCPCPGFLNTSTVLTLSNAHLSYQSLCM